MFLRQSCLVRPLPPRLFGHRLYMVELYTHLSARHTSVYLIFSKGRFRLCVSWYTFRILWHRSGDKTFQELCEIMRYNAATKSGWLCLKSSLEATLTSARHVYSTVVLYDGYKAFSTSFAKGDAARNGRKASEMFRLNAPIIALVIVHGWFFHSWVQDK